MGAPRKGVGSSCSWAPGVIVGLRYAREVDMLGLSFSGRKFAVLATLLTSCGPGLWGLWRGLIPAPRGVNDAGAEFNGRAVDRREPLWLSSVRTRAYVAKQGLSVIRLPFCWESVQPSLGGALAPGAVAQLRKYVASAHSLGVQVILEPHNSARYTVSDSSGGSGGTVAVIGDAKLPYAYFSDFWRRMSLAFSGQPGVYAYNLMNEPHDIVTRNWEIASQEAVTAIRATGDRRLILVPGSNYSSCHTWVMCHGRKGWISDSAGAFAYEAHLYYSLNHGDYPLSFGEESRRDPSLERRTLDRLHVFTAWCQENGVQGFIGETGCPPDEGWCSIMDKVFAELDRVHMGATVWALGERWPSGYPLSVHPRGDFNIDRPQMVVLRAHSAGRSSALQAWCYGYEVAGARCRGWLRPVKSFVVRVCRHALTVTADALYGAP